MHNEGDPFSPKSQSPLFAFFCRFMTIFFFYYRGGKIERKIIPIENHVRICLKIR